MALADNTNNSGSEAGEGEGEEQQAAGAGGVSSGGAAAGGGRCGVSQEEHLKLLQRAQEAEQVRWSFVNSFLCLGECTTCS